MRRFSAKRSVPSKVNLMILEFFKITFYENLTLISLIMILLKAPLNWKRSSVAPRSERLLKKTKPRKSRILEGFYGEVRHGTFINTDIMFNSV